MAQRWFYKELGEPVGPLGSSDLVALARAGEIGPDTLVRVGGDGRWVPAYRVRGLRHVMAGEREPGPADTRQALGHLVSERLLRLEMDAGREEVAGW